MNELADLAYLIPFAQNNARTGKQPHEILNLLSEHILTSSRFIELEWVLMHAFNIPLRVAREIEGWHRLTPHGSLTDSEIDQLFAPYIQQFLKI